MDPSINVSKGNSSQISSSAFLPIRFLFKKKVFYLKQLGIKTFSGLNKWHKTKKDAFQIVFACGLISNSTLRQLPPVEIKKLQLINTCCGWSLLVDFKIFIQPFWEFNGVILPLSLKRFVSSWHLEVLNLPNFVFSENNNSDVS